MKRYQANGHWGAVDDSGNWVIPCQYEEFEKFLYGTAWVKLGGKWGLIDKTGKTVVPCEYEKRKKTGGERYIKVKKKEKWGMLYRSSFPANTQEIVPCEYEEVGKHCCRIILVKKNGKWGAVHEKGSVILPCEYEEIRGFGQIRDWYMPESWLGYAFIRKGDKWGWADARGTIRIPCEYDFIGTWQNGIVRVKKNGKWGYRNSRGILAVPLRYDYALDYQTPDGWFAPVAKVMLAGKWGILDCTGSETYPCRFDRIEPQKGVESAGSYDVWRNGERDFLYYGNKKEKLQEL